MVDGTVILALRQYPQGGWATRVSKSKTTAKIPLSLDGRGIKGEGEQDSPSLCHSGQSEESKISDHNTPARHCGLDPQSRGAAGRHG